MLLNSFMASVAKYSATSSALHWAMGIKQHSCKGNRSVSLGDSMRQVVPQQALVQFVFSFFPQGSFKLNLSDMVDDG